MSEINLQNLLDCESEATQVIILRLLSKDEVTVELDETELFSVTFQNRFFLLGEPDNFSSISTDSKNLSYAIDLIRSIDCKEFKVSYEDNVAGYNNQVVIDFSL